MSRFLGKPAPPAAPNVNFVEPLSRDEEKSSLAFFNILNFVLQFCPTDPSETELMARFAKIGVGGGRSFDANALSPEMRSAFQDGVTNAWATFDEFKKTELDTGKVTSADGFGTREFLKGNYLFRMAAAIIGIYGLSKEEAIYPAYFVDSTGQRLNGAHRYTLTFAQDQLPPVNAFWSLTLYDLPASLLYANPINRYLINSPMLPALKRGADGSITIFLQHETPGKDKESNWLPVPAGAFWTTLRLYWPKPAALDGRWKQPPLERVN